MSRLPPKAATGIPPPMTLPNIVMSGSMWYRDWAPPSATRKPVMTSSTMRTVPCLAVSSLMVSRNSWVAGTMFMLPATASTITQAISSPSLSKSSLSCLGLLYSRTIVSFVTAAGTPAELGVPKVSKPEPPLTSRESLWPW